MADAIEVVSSFCDEMSKRDPEALRPYLAQGVVYQNTGMPAKKGIDDVLADLAGQFSMFPDTYEYRTENIAANGNVVLTERVDIINGFDGSLHGVPGHGNLRCRRWPDHPVDRLLRHGTHRQDAGRRGLHRPRA